MFAYYYYYQMGISDVIASCLMELTKKKTVRTFWSLNIEQTTWMS